MPCGATNRDGFVFGRAGKDSPLCGSQPAAVARSCFCLAECTVKTYSRTVALVMVVLGLSALLALVLRRQPRRESGRVI